MDYLVKDKAFYKKTISIGLPIAGQQLITAGVNMVDTIMLGHVSETVLAAASLGAQVHLISNYIGMGVGGGANTLLARFWGAKDEKSLRMSITIAFRLIVAVMVIYTLLVGLFPVQTMRIMTTNTGVASEGVKYLQWSVPCYLLVGVTIVASCVLRNIGKAKIPLYASIGAFFINIFFNWLFIFGKLGAPEMGIAGAALGTLISRVFEAAFVLGYLFLVEKKLCYRLKNLFQPCRVLVREFCKITVPVMISDTLWGIATGLLSAVGGRISEAFMAAASITAALHNFVVIFNLGLGQSAQIIVGNTLGENRIDEVRKQCRTFILLGFVISIVTGLVLVILANPILNGYVLSENTRAVGLELIYAQAVALVFIVPGALMVKGIIRAGGDTRFLMATELITIWLFSIPLGYIAGVILHWPAFTVFLLLKIDNLLKFLVCMIRYRSNKWIKVIKGAR